MRSPHRQVQQVQISAWRLPALPLPAHANLEMGRIVFPRDAVITRRSLLTGAGALASSAGLSGWPAFAQPVLPARAQKQESPAHPEITGQLSAYMSEAAHRELPADVQEKAKQHILDTLAAMISGADLAPAKTALKFVRAYGGQPVATVVGTNLACGPIEAALANGMRAHSDETDDSNAPSHSHPGCSIVPAALAAGEKFGISGSQLVRAVTLGYDVGTRVTITLGGLDYQMRTHRDAHSIVSTFGACAAAASAASLNQQQMRWVLDYAAQQASGIAAWQRDTHHVEKALTFAGFTARNGVTAALLIQLGATGVDDIFAGSDNFFDAFNPQANPEGLIDRLGDFYQIANTNIKKWSVGSPIQAPLDALQYILQQHPFKPADVRKVTVTVATDEARTVNNRDIPNICMQHLIALMLVKGTVSFQESHDRKLMTDPAILEARAKVDLAGSPDLQKLYPQLVGIVDVILNDGTRYNHRVDAVRGTVRNPMSSEEVAAKAKDLMGPFLGETRTARLVETVLHLEGVPDIRSLRPLLQTT
jgi:2-methylcitrate dehydratase PrpD